MHKRRWCPRIIFEQSNRLRLILTKEITVLLLDRKTEEIKLYPQGGCTRAKNLWPVRRSLGSSILTILTRTIAQLG
jgi:hypothetical protein